MKLYFARHGETIWNVESKICGLTDIELTERGRRQAEALAEAVSGRSIDLILSSPLKRALQTAETAAQRNGIPIQVEPRLIEQDYGIYEGVDRQNPDFLANKRCFAYRYPGGESMMQVAYRVYGLIDELKEKYADKNVLLISHGGVCRVLHSYFQDMTNDEFFHYSIGNCVLSEYEL